MSSSAWLISSAAVCSTSFRSGTATGSISGADGESQIAGELKDQTDQQDRERDRNHQLGRPGHDLDVDRRVPEIEGALEMAVGVGDEHRDDEDGERGSHRLGDPQRPAPESGDHELHADMTADPLHEGDGEYRESHHRRPRRCRYSRRSERGRRCGARSARRQAASAQRSGSRQKGSAGFRPIRATDRPARGRVRRHRS